MTKISSPLTYNSPEIHLYFAKQGRALSFVRAYVLSRVSTFPTISECRSIFLGAF